MKRLTASFAAMAALGWLAAVALCSDNGKGRGGGLMGGHGAPPVFAHPASTSGHGANSPAVSGPRAMAGRMHAPPASLANNPGLSRSLTPLLPAGLSLQAAASGFRNTGQFVAALHVSQNLSIPFSQLKAQMTGPNAVSLGKAIQNLRPGLSPQTAKSDERTARRQAEQDFASAGVLDRLNQNPQLARTLTPLLPSGMSLETAASGFSSAGRFAAALHLSQNLGIPFSQLKAEMTGADHDSLGKALRDLRPDLGSDTVKQDVRTATTQARQDLSGTHAAGQLASSK